MIEEVKNVNKVKVSDYIVSRLIDMEISDIFGIPGGVILELLYAVNRQSDKIRAHLMYHEQDAVFAACGYAQVEMKIGVAYATRGPGITNMITGITDAYYDSIPLLIITGHSSIINNSNLRVEEDQELNPVNIVSSITKYSKRIDSVDSFLEEFNKACNIAMTGRKGPVLLDISMGVLENVINVHDEKNACKDEKNVDKIIEEIKEHIKKAHRPILLIGDGIHQAKMEKSLQRIVDQFKMPVLSSRGAQDLISGNKWYYGYIGSHGIRYSNFILSKCDTIISLGNRMSFPIDSPTFKPIFDNANVIRFEIDKEEAERYIPNAICYLISLEEIMPKMEKLNVTYKNNKEWLNVCLKIKEKLHEFDTEFPVDKIKELLLTISPESVIISDVGNNEFWLSRAYEASNINNRILCSRSYGTLGNALGKAIGAYYRCKKIIICFIGDQGLQLCIQELQFIVNNKIPIKLVLLNNKSSGMIKSREIQKYNSQFIQTTLESGYSVPDFQAIACAYKIESYNITNMNMKKIKEIIEDEEKPNLLELNIDENIDLDIKILRKNKCQNMFPFLDEKLYDYLDNL